MALAVDDIGSAIAAVVLAWVVVEVMRGRRLAKRPPTERFPLPAAQATNLSLDTIASIGGRKPEVTGSTISFTTGMSWLSWRGQRVDIEIKDNGDGSTDVTVRADAKPSFQLYDWNEGARIRTRFFDELRSRSGPSPAR